MVGALDRRRAVSLLSAQRRAVAELPAQVEIVHGGVRAFNDFAIHIARHAEVPQSPFLTHVLFAETK